MILPVDCIVTILKVEILCLIQMFGVYQSTGNSNISVVMNPNKTSIVITA